MRVRGEKQHATWLPVRTADGSFTLRGPHHGEACHSLDGAFREARERYVEACSVPRLLRERELVRVLDVGTGPGWNVAALLRASCEASGAALEVLTLELDEECFDAGEVCVELDESGGGEWLAAARRALSASRDEGGARVAWRSPDVRGGACLRIGDARSSLAALPSERVFDVVFLDAFSPRTEPELWQPDFLAELGRRMAPTSWLSTYTASLSVRAGLRAAGLAVGRGPRVGSKSAGTRAGRGIALEPFDDRTERKLARRAERLARRD